MIELKNTFFTYIENNTVKEVAADLQENYEAMIGNNELFVIESETPSGKNVKSVEFDVFTDSPIKTMNAYTDTAPFVDVDFIQKTDCIHVMITDKDISSHEWSDTRKLLMLEFDINDEKFILRVRKYNA